LKALILSGGEGTRLRPITHTSAKQLVPVANKPILFYGIEAVRETGITDVGIVVGATREEIRQAVGDGSKWGIRVTYIEQEAPLGIAHAVKISSNYIGNDPFVLYLGDNLILGGIKEFTETFQKEKPNSQILLVKVPNPSQFGVAELNGQNVISLEEKPKHPKSDLALVGVYMFDKTVFEAVNSIRPSARNELEITDAIQYLIDRKYTVNSHVIRGWWKDTGKLDDLLAANQMILDSLETDIRGEMDDRSTAEFKVTIGRGCRIVNSTIRGPAIVGEGTEIIDSYVGPFTSIGENVTLEGSEVERSIIMENCRIRHVRGRIQDSLIGKNVEIEKSSSRPKSYRLMLGDSSRVGLP
jgi:glucose-1-phosphate thymidylyltransferase